ncbi:MAG: DUF4258 domain-containing protein [Caldilineaceae bacterium]|nr:DUF4258 domain-containing protein [Caldilineaceae bacterium]MCB0080156.1 DUF4258 domain-containing protein [Caldilineaceae bacterium]
MKLFLTAHAQTRMRQRKISETDIQWVLVDPDEIEEYNGEAMAMRAGEERLLKVVYELVADDTYKIITAIAQRRRTRRR